MYISSLGRNVGNICLIVFGSQIGRCHESAKMCDDDFALALALDLEESKRALNGFIGKYPKTLTTHWLLQ